MRPIKCYKMPKTIASAVGYSFDFYIAHTEQTPCSRTVILGSKPICFDLPTTHFFLWRAISPGSRKPPLIVLFEKNGVITYSGFPNCAAGGMCTGQDTIPFIDSISEQLKYLVSYFWQSRFDYTTSDCGIGLPIVSSWWTDILVKIIRGELEDYRVKEAAAIFLKTK